ncbi:MAG: hypothetical protein ACREM8_13760, partial [Vulcanimicrobiaceae bacterium]
MARPGYVHSSQKAGPYTPTRGRFAGTTFRSYRAYQNANAEAKGFRSAASRLASPKRIAKTDLGGMKKPSRIRALKALNRLRRGENIETAAREAGTTVANIKRYAGQAIRKGPRGRLVGAKFDSLPVVLNVSTEAGTIEVAVAGSRERVLVATYESALARVSRTGDVAE